MTWRPKPGGLAVAALAAAASVALLVYLLPPARSPHHAVRTRELKIASGSDSRTVLLCVPSDAAIGRLPLILAFHGIGDSPRSMREYSKLDELAAHGRCTVAFLGARSGMWATEEATDSPLNENRDVRFVCDLLETLSQYVQFDDTRVYAVGMSNGATFAERLSLALPCRIAATVGHSGGLPPDAPREPDARCVPLLLVVGEKDGAAGWVRETAANLRAIGHEVELIVEPGLGHEWDRSQNEEIWSFLTQRRLPEPCEGADCGGSATTSAHTTQEL